MTAEELYGRLERELPAVFAYEDDPDGIGCMPDPRREIRKILVALDPYLPAIEKAKGGGYDLLLTHHPLVYGESDLCDPTVIWRSELAEAGIASFAFHMRLDAAHGGVNDVLAQKLALQNVRPFGESRIGRIGELGEPVPVRELALFVSRVLNASRVRYADHTHDGCVRTVAVVGGAGSSLLWEAAQAGVDVLVTGEVKHHIFGVAAGAGISPVEAGHYATEAPVCERLAEIAHQASDGTASVDIFYHDISQTV